MSVKTVVSTSQKPGFRKKHLPFNVTSAELKVIIVNVVLLAFVIVYAYSAGGIVTAITTVAILVAVLGFGVVVASAIRKVVNDYEDDLRNH